MRLIILESIHIIFLSSNETRLQSGFKAKIAYKTDTTSRNSRSSSNKFCVAGYIPLLCYQNNNIIIY